MSTRAGERFINEFNCPDVLVKELSQNIVRVRGCGLVATYVCGNQSNQCVKESSYAATAADEVKAESEKAKTLEPQTTRTTKPDADTFQAIFRREAGFLTISAQPIKAPEQVHIQVQLSNGCEKCEAKLAVDGALIALTHVASTSPKLVEATFNASDLAKLAASHKATLRVGQLDWEVSADDKATLKELISNCRQEQALSGVIMQSSGSEAPNQAL